MKISRILTRNAMMAALFTGLSWTPTIIAQTIDCPPVVSFSGGCSCGRWTCPVCQGQCEPVQQPGMSAVTPGQSGIAGQSGDTNSGMNGQSLGSDAASDAAARQAFNASNRTDSLRADTNRFASRLSAPEFIGDFLQVGGPSTFGLTFGYDNVMPQYGGPPFDFNVAGDSTTDLFSTGTGNSLQEPTVGSDAAQPAGAGWTFTGSSVTQNPDGTYNIRYFYEKQSDARPVAAIGRLKLAENSSPIPRNRIFVNYSNFKNVPLAPGGIPVNRISPGFETLLFGPNQSFEFRAPFATTVDSNILIDGATNTNNTEFGNLFFSLKRIAFKTDSWLMSGGLSMLAPTADDTKVFDANHLEIARVQNHSWHLMPFLGLFYAPNDTFFSQAMLQVDVDATGSPVLTRKFINADPGVRNGPSPLERDGRYTDMTLLYLDWANGVWLYRNTNRNARGLTGLAAISEFHFNRSLNGADRVQATNTPTVIQSPIAQFDIVNLVGGFTAEINRVNRFTAGYVAPVGNNADRPFDGEIRVTYNRLY